MTTHQLTNWAGNVTFGGDRVHRSSSLGELQELVAASPRVRALGTGHSFNRIADTDGVMVSLAALPEVVAVDASSSSVTVGGGVRYSRLAARLHESGWAVPNLASLPHISVAGSCATATHGSGDANGNLATAVSAMELVMADGELVRLSRETLGERFDGAVVSLGTLGVVTAVTLEVIASFDVRQQVYEGLALDELTAQLDEIFASAYSVSLFTDWRSQRINQAWVKRRVGDAWNGGRTFFGATPVEVARHPVPGMSAIHCTDQLGVPGPWHERLPHFRDDFTPSSGEELQSEYLVPREHAVAALETIGAIHDRIAPVLQICELRTVAADQLWLSPGYRRDTLGIHFTWIKDYPAVHPVLGLIEERLGPIDARPHWGKLFTTPPEVVRSLYPRLPDFVKLARELDPTGKFRNDFVDRYVPS